MAKMLDRSFERKLEQLNKDPKVNSIAEYFEQFQVLNLNLNYFAFTTAAAWGNSVLVAQRYPA